MQIITTLLFVIFGTMILISLSVSGVFFYVYSQRKKKREARSLASVLLEVRVPRSNEVKIDAMEQLIGGLYSIKEGGWKSRFNSQPVVSFEIVAFPERITYYIWTHKEFRELVERQVHGAYPDAELVEVPEYELFATEGKVAYKSYQLAKENYYPM